MKNTPSTCGLVACLEPDQERSDKRRENSCGVACICSCVATPLAIVPYVMVLIAILLTLLDHKIHVALFFLAITVLPEASLWLIFYAWQKARAPCCRSDDCCYSFFYSDYLPRKWTTIEQRTSRGDGRRSVQHFNRKLEHI